MKTKVIFRKLNAQVVALFPELPATPDPRYCDSYSHVGQHGSADPLLFIQYSKPAQPEEYAALKHELETHYEYNLKVLSRLPGDAYQTRRNAINEVK